MHGTLIDSSFVLFLTEQNDILLKIHARDWRLGPAAGVSTFHSNTFQAADILYQRAFTASWEQFPILGKAHCRPYLRSCPTFPFGSLASMFPPRALQRPHLSLEDKCTWSPITTTSIFPNSKVFKLTSIVPYPQVSFADNSIHQTWENLVGESNDMMSESSLGVSRRKSLRIETIILS